MHLLGEFTVDFMTGEINEYAVLEFRKNMTSPMPSSCVAIITGRHGGIGRQTPVQRLQAWKARQVESLCSILHNAAQKKNAGYDAGLKIAA
ncbi:MAG: hypothetical protein R8K46_10615 [Mariprofundaceae bacterium]